MMDLRTGNRATHKAVRGDANSGNGHANGLARQKDTAQYLSDMILELRTLAKSAKLYHVMVPLEYAYYEAFSAANRVDIPEEEVARLKELSLAAEQIDPKPEDYC